MTSIAIKNLQRLRNHRLVKGTVGFLNWWWDELVGGLPPGVRDFLNPHQERLMARIAGDEVLLWRDADGDEELARFRPGDDEDIGRQVVRGALAGFEDQRARAWFLIDEDQVLIQHLHLPAAAEENLRQVLTYEMDRHTPFSADQVCFDFRVLGRREGSNQIQVELITARRELIERVWKLATERDLPLDGVDVCRRNADGRLVVLGVNLLDPARRARRNRRRLKIVLGLAVVFVGLLYLVMWQSLVARERALADFEVRTQRAATQARQVSELRDQLTEAREAASFLSERKDSQPAIVNVLNEVTRALPNEVWVQRLQISGDQVDLTGQAPEASALLQLLERSPCLEGANAKGAFTPDAQSGKERFTIAVTVTCKGFGNGTAAAG